MSRQSLHAQCTNSRESATTYDVVPLVGPSFIFTHNVRIPANSRESATTNDVVPLVFSLYYSFFLRAGAELLNSENACVQPAMSTSEAEERSLIIL